MREHKAEGRRGMDEEARGRRKLGEKTDSYCRERSRETESECERED